jgi:transcriptional regulator with XRE-family HTH domain
VKTNTRKPYYRDDVFLKKIGEKVRFLRQEAGLSQMDLAFRCNDKDYSQINRLELGKINFSVSYLKLVSNALKVKVLDLIPEE